MEAARGRAVLAVVIASLLWGTTGTVATFLPDAVSPIAVGASTMGVGGLLLFATAPRLSVGVLGDPGARRWVLVGTLGVFVYPLATLFCIVVTANHYWIDGAGGLLCFAVGTLAGWGLHRWNQQRLDRKHLAALGLTATADSGSVPTAGT